MSKVKANTIENVAGDKSVAVAGLSKIEDTGKNICTAWVSFDGTTTPPTIEASYNVSSVERVNTGEFKIHFATTMDNENFSCSGVMGKHQLINHFRYVLDLYDRTTAYVYIQTGFGSAGTFSKENAGSGTSIQVFGGKA